MNSEILVKTKAVPAPGIRSIPKMKDCIALAKPKIGLMALVVSAGSIALAPGHISGFHMATVLAGIFLLVSGAGALNMYLERDIDGLMLRTQNRPLPAGRMHPSWALFIGLMMTLVGLQVLVVFGHPMTLFLGLFASFMYVLVYTPMKTKTWWSLPVGAIPGALPGLIGYSAVAGQLDLPAWILFFVLWAWQIPHTMAIWIYRRKEYQEAGYAILPDLLSNEKMVWAIVGTSFLYILGTGLIWGAGFGGVIYALVALLSGVWFMAIASSVNTSESLNKWARKVFLATLVHQTAIFLVLALDVGLRAMLVA
jgi:heme o synthase